MSRTCLLITNNLIEEYGESVIAPDAEFEIHPKKADILKYLHSFPVDGVVAGKIYDSVKEEYTDVYEKMYYDGMYDWLESDIYYFNHYNIKLKPEFIQRAIQ